jgi:hypothetical protein
MHNYIYKSESIDYSSSTSLSFIDEVSLMQTVTPGGITPAINDIEIDKPSMLGTRRT